MNTVFWWGNNLLALTAAVLFFAGYGQAGAVCFALSVLCGMARSRYG